MALDGRLDAEAADERVDLTFEVRNAGDDPVELQFTDSQRAEFVADDGEETVWRFGDGRMFAQVMETERIPPGEAMTVECEWEHPPTGTYELTATLSASGAECAATTRVTI